MAQQTLHTSYDLNDSCFYDLVSVRRQSLKAFPSASTEVIALLELYTVESTENLLYLFSTRVFQGSCGGTRRNSSHRKGEVLEDPSE